MTGTGSAERPLLRVGWRPATEPSAADRLLADLVTWHVEKYWCPSIVSSDLLTVVPGSTDPKSGSVTK